ncbi:TPA: DUF551 domain-containing protein [Enterobacter ludwigii]|nr:DUF551 domain-containing protein [Enterobacter ludwigii]
MSTINREFTKEQLIARINQVTAINKYRISRDSDADGLVMDNELFAIAQASLEAEPAIHRWRRVTVEPYGPYPWHYGNFIGFSKSVDGIEDEYFYSVPPAPVSVPDLLEQFAEFMAAESIKSGDYPDGWQCKASNAAHEYAQNIRAAMLQCADTELQRKAAIHDVLCAKYNVESLADFVDWQRNHIAELEAAPPAPVSHGEAAVMPDYPGYALTQRECFEAGKKARLAELVTTTNKLPDGWVACSERMPKKGQEVLCTDRFENYETALYDTGYIPGPPFFATTAGEFHPTHWMPLPAAPQQEV